MKGGKGGRARKTGGAARKAAVHPRAGKTGSTRGPGAPPKKGSRKKPHYGGIPSEE